jgi:hypothetical protein
MEAIQSSYTKTLENKSCTHKCSDCKGDYTPIIEDVENLISSIEKFLYRESEKFDSFICHGGPKPDFVDVKELKILKSLLQRFKVNIYLVEKGEDPYICPSKFLDIKEKVIKIIGTCDVDAKRQIVTYENETSWLLQNPGWIAFEYWERVLVKQSISLGFKVEEIKKEQRKIAWNVMSMETQKRKVTFKVLKHIAKNYKSSFKVTKKESKEYESMWSIRNMRDVYSEKYGSLLKSGLSINIINQALKNGLSFRLINNEHYINCGETTVNLKEADLVQAMIGQIE